MIELSIIIPVFNRETTLCLCIDSLLDTNMTDCEIILIDDGSTDKSSILCKEYAEKYPNIKYIYKQNGGVSSARNLGLSVAKGKWITFVDSDDAVRKEHFDIIKDHDIKDADLLIESFVNIDINSLSNKNFSFPQVNFNKRISENPCLYYFSDIPKTNTPMFSVWGKFYRRDICIVNNINFREDIHLGEDQIFNLDYLLHTNKLYHYPDMQTYIQIERNITDNGKRLSSTIYPLDKYYHFIETSYNKFRMFDKISNNMNIGYAINNMVSGIINLTLINYQRRKYAQLIKDDDLYIFTKNKIYPLFSSIQCYSKLIDGFNKRIIFLLITKGKIRVALLYTRLISIYRSIKAHI